MVHYCQTTGAKICVTGGERHLEHRNIAPILGGSPWNEQVRTQLLAPWRVHVHSVAGRIVERIRGTRPAPDAFVLGVVEVRLKLIIIRALSKAGQTVFGVITELIV